ncbi:MAG: DoxX family protein [Bacteroidota bacterium]
MNIALWIVQGLLAAMFLMAGIMKLSQPKATLKEKIGDWIDDFSLSSIRVIGLLELLAAIGLIAPMLLNIAPILTPLAGAGLVLTMLVAAVIHARRSENKEVGMNVMLLGLAAFVFVGRMYLLPVM